MSNFRELLSQPTDSVERPRPLPAGNYIGKIKGHVFDTSKNKGTPFVRFILVPEEPCADVQGDLTGFTLGNYELRKEYYITPKALYRLADMLDATLGKEAGRMFDERIPETTELRVQFKVTERPSEDGTEIYNDVGLITAVGAAARQAA